MIQKIKNKNKGQPSHLHYFHGLPADLPARGCSHLPYARLLAAQVTFIRCRLDPFLLLLKTFQWFFTIPKLPTNLLKCLRIFLPFLRASWPPAAH